MSHETLFIERAKLVFPVLFEGRAADECWMWSGRVTWSVKKDGKTLSTVLRRVAYAAFIGDIPQYHEVKTTCEHRDCVNPKHLTTRISVRQITKQLEDRSLSAVTGEGSELDNEIAASTPSSEETID
jgi:hypothetical protein